MKALLRWLSNWPLARLHRLGWALGWMAWAVAPSYRRHLREYAAQAGLCAAQRRAAIAEAGRMAAEVPWLWLMPPNRALGPLVRWDGAQWVERALQSGRGVLFLTPHLGSFEVAARAIVERFGAHRPLTVLYRPGRHAVLRDMQERSRQRPGLATAPASLAGVRQMLRALRCGEMVGLLPDQVPPYGQGVWAPFFGRSAYTMTLSTRLALQTGAELLLVWCERLPRGQGFVLHVEDFAEPLPSPDEAGEAAQIEAASAVNRAMERLIRRCPEQYLWGYNRYKLPRGQRAPSPP